MAQNIYAEVNECHSDGGGRGRSIGNAGGVGAQKGRKGGQGSGSCRHKSTYGVIKGHPGEVLP